MVGCDCCDTAVTVVAAARESLLGGAKHQCLIDAGVEVGLCMGMGNPRGLWVWVPGGYGCGFSPWIPIPIPIPTASQQVGTHGFANNVLGNYELTSR